MIQQLAAAIARAVGAARAGDAQRAREEIETAWNGFVGLRRRDIARLDPATIRALLGDKRELAIMLLEAEAELGDADAAKILGALR